MTTPALVTEVRSIVKKDPDWLEKLTGPQLKLLAKLNPDLTEIHDLDESGRKRTVLRPECNNRYKLYRLLRSRHRVPKNRHAEEILKTKEL